MSFVFLVFVMYHGGLSCSLKDCRVTITPFSQTFGAWVCLWLKWLLASIPFRLPGRRNWRGFLATRHSKTSWKRPKWENLFQVSCFRRSSKLLLRLNLFEVIS